MKAYILATGDELVRGRTVDRNTGVIARRLSELGIGIVGAATVPDDHQELTDVILRGAGRADIVFMTGGLGPTEDDYTRRAAAAAAGVGLRQVPELAAALRERWSLRGRPMPENNLRQAEIPETATVISNRFGTAPGFRVKVGKAELIALPGPPHEMRGVLEEEVLPDLEARYASTPRLVRTRTVDSFGWTESRVGEVLHDLMLRGVGPHVGTSAEQGTIRVVVHDEGEPEAVRERLDACCAEIRRRLGKIVHGENGSLLHEIVGARLIESGVTLSTAESCTGGKLGSALTCVPGISAVYPGGVIAYSNAQKARLLGVPEALLGPDGPGAVSEEIARAMAEGVRASFETDLGIGITGIAGPGGGSEEKPVGLVHLALASAEGTIHRRAQYTVDRNLVRILTVKSALDMVRLHLDHASI